MTYRWNKYIWGTMRQVAMIAIASLGVLFVPNVQYLLAAESDSLNVTIRPKDSYPPAPVQDLSAVPGGVGQMMLQWTAPDSNNNLITPPSAVSSYQIRIATFSIDSLGGDTTSWWTQAQDVSGEPPPSTPGTTEYFLLNGLTQGVTYYAAIFSVDDVGLVSLIDSNSSTPGQQAHAFIVSALAPPTPTGFTGVALSTSSILWGWDASAGAAYYRLRDGPSGTLVIQTISTSTVESGLSPNQRVQRTISAGTGINESPPSSISTVYTLAAVPTNLTITGTRFDWVALSWNTAGNATGTRYVVERSLDGSSYISVTTQTATTITNSGLSELTTYYYRIRAINGDDILTTPSLVVSTMTPKKLDLLAPDVPMGLKGSLDPSGVAFTLLWEDVKQNADGTPITDLVGYNIYRRTTITGTPSRVTPIPINVRAFADVVNGQTLYYTVRAIDTSGNESEESLVADSSPDENVIFIGSDNLSTLSMPDEVNDLLRSNFNKYGVPLTVGMSEEPVPSNTEIVRTIKLYLLRGDTKSVVQDLAFAKPQSVIAMAYNIVNGQVGFGSPLLSGTQTRVAAISPNQLSLYWHNGVTWVKVGGTVDQARQVVKIKSSFLGAYQLRVAAAATSLTLEQANVYPRVFSPNGDGFNDRVYFVLENPNNAGVTGEIYDMGGREVATIKQQAGTGIGTTLIWDGRDTNGAVVPGGVYVYKIRGEGKTFTGTVAVAR